MVGVVVPHALFAQSYKPAGQVHGPVYMVGGVSISAILFSGKLGGQQPGKGSEEQGERVVPCALRIDPKLRGTKTRVLRMPSQLSSLRAGRHRHRTDFALNYMVTTLMTTHKHSKQVRTKMFDLCARPSSTRSCGIEGLYGGPGGRERTLYTCAFHVCGFVV